MSIAKLQPEKGRILISEPFLGDPNFTRSVVLLVEHNEEGTIGFVLNHAVELSLADVAVDNNLPDIPLIKGGPVELNTIHFIHDLGHEIENSFEVKKGLWWGGDFDQVLKILEEEDAKKDHFKFFIGYSGWAPGQLDGELEGDAWIVSTIGAREALSQVVNSQELWKQTMGRLGGEFSILSNSPLDPSWN